jgi:hypothetical protein
MALGHMALAPSNIHYGLVGPSRGRGRVRASHGHHMCAAHRGTGGGCSTSVVSTLGWWCKLEGFSGVCLARWEMTELT